MISGDIMNNKKIIGMLKEVSRRKRIEYIVEEVKSRLLRKELVESLKSSKRLVEQFQNKLDTGKVVAPSETGQRQSRVSSADFSKYPDPSDIEDQILALVDADNLSPSDSLAVFGTGSGPGTYKQLITDFKNSVSSSQNAKQTANSIDDIVSSMLSPGKSEEDLKKLRSAAARILRGTKGSGIKKKEQ